MAHSFAPGGTTWFPSDSTMSGFSIAFQDDGETGYVYAYDCSGPEPVVIDAMQVYDVGADGLHGVHAVAEIVWADEGTKAGLLLNQRLETVIDFLARAAYSRINHPPPSAGWVHHLLDDLDEEVVRRLRNREPL